MREPVPAEPPVRSTQQEQKFLTLAGWSEWLPQEYEPWMGSYTWTSRDLYEVAVEAATGILLAEQRDDARMRRFLEEAVIDLWNKDRATCGAYLVGSPVYHNDDLPCPVNHKIVVDDLQPWSHDIPFAAVTNINKIQKQAPGDSWVWVTYKPVKSVATYRDPVIYAQYGDWYVRVAQWG